MISPRIDKLLEHVDSDYASVIVAAKRARQINSYYHNLGEGTFDEFPPRWSTPAPRTTSRSRSRKSPPGRSSTSTASSGPSRNGPFESSSGPSRDGPLTGTHPPWLG